ncbi:MAG: hypothetical protein WCG96_10490 [Actinomycetes bacterium]
MGSVHRIEQAGDHLMVTAGGIIHDMVCDGTEEHGVTDLVESSSTTPIIAVASRSGAEHVLRPGGLPGIEVTRRRDGDA